MSDVSNESPLHVAKVAVKHRLRQAKQAAWDYLEGFDANDLCAIMEAIEETVDTPEDEECHAIHKLSTLENLKQMGHRVQDFFYNEWQGAISLMDIFATVAYTRAEDGERALSGYGISEDAVAEFGNIDFASYGLAIEACMDAWEALHFGRTLEDKREKEALTAREAEKIEAKRVGKNKGGMTTKMKAEKLKGSVLKKFEKILESGCKTIKVSDLNFRVRFPSGEINADGCAEYLTALHGEELGVSTKKVAEYIRAHVKMMKELANNFDEKRRAERQARHIALKARLYEIRISREDSDEKTRSWPSRSK